MQTVRLVIGQRFAAHSGWYGSSFVAWCIRGVDVRGACMPRASTASWLALRRLQSRLRELCTGPVFDTSDSVRDQLRVRSTVRLFISDAHTTPMAWGLLQPHILLPASTQQWGPQRLRAVLTHEMSHIRRKDMLTQLVVQLAHAFYWFHPPLWFVAWRIRVERERACDDVVVSSGMEAADYAEHLLRMTAGRGNLQLAHVAGLAMSRSHRLEGRLLALLSNKTNRQATS